MWAHTHQYESSQLTNKLCTTSIQPTTLTHTPQYEPHASHNSHWPNNIDTYIHINMRDRCLEQQSFSQQDCRSTVSKFRILSLFFNLVHKKAGQIHLSGRLQEHQEPTKWTPPFYGSFFWTIFSPPCQVYCVGLIFQ